MILLADMDARLYCLGMKSIVLWIILRLLKLCKHFSLHLHVQHYIVLIHYRAHTSVSVATWSETGVGCGSFSDFIYIKTPAAVIPHSSPTSWQKFIINCTVFHRQQQAQTLQN